jgi:hypothetical protein
MISGDNCAVSLLCALGIYFPARLYSRQDGHPHQSCIIVCNRQYSSAGHEQRYRNTAMASASHWSRVHGAYRKVSYFVGG